MKKKRFSVKTFQWFVEKYKDQEYPTRKLVIIKEDLSWEEAKKLQKENKDSWIV